MENKISKEQILECENFIILVMKKIIQQNNDNLEKVTTLSEKLEILKLYLQSSQLDLGLIRKQFINLGLTGYLNATQLDGKLKKLIFYFVFLNKKDPFVFINYFDDFREKNIKGFDYFIFSKVLTGLLGGKDDTISKKQDGENLSLISFKGQTYFQRDDIVIEEQKGLGLFGGSLKLLEKEFEYKDESKNKNEDDLKLGNERIYFKQFDTLGISNDDLVSLINFSNKNESLFEGITILKSFKFEKNIYQNDENQEESLKNKYGYYFYFDYNVGKNYSSLCENFFNSYYSGLENYYNLIKKSVEIEEGIEKIRSQERKIQITLLSLIQVFGLFFRTQQIQDSESTYYEKTKNLFKFFIYFSTLLNFLHGTKAEEILIKKELGNKRKIGFILGHSDISIKNNKKIIHGFGRDDIENIGKKYLLCEIFGYTESQTKQIQDINSILGFSKKGIGTGNNVIFKHFITNISRIQEISICGKEYHHSDIKSIQELYKDSGYQIVYSMNFEGGISHILQIKKDEETGGFLGFGKKKTNGIEEVKEIIEKNNIKVFSSGIVKTPFNFMKIYENSFYLPYQWYHFHSKSLNYALEQKSIYNLLKNYLNKIYGIPVKFMLIHKHGGSGKDGYLGPFFEEYYTIENYIIDGESIFSQISKDGIFSGIFSSGQKIILSIKS